MKHTLPSLETLKAFESAARHMSFSTAAEELCLTKGGISYQIRKLESELGQALFKRKVRQVLLTDAGQHLLITTQRIFNDLAVSIDKLNADNQTRRIVIGATTYVAARWLSPRIAAFRQQHPDVSISFHHAVNDSDFNLDEVDFAIRWARCDGKIIGDKLCELPMTMFAVCNKAMAKRLPKNLDNLALKGQTILCEDRSEDLWRRWAKESSILQSTTRQVVADANVRVQAAIDGQGLILADDMMQNELRNRSLVSVFNQQLDGYGYVLMRSSIRREEKNASLLANWLLQQMTATAPQTVIGQRVEVDIGDAGRTMAK